MNVDLKQIKYLTFGSPLIDMIVDVDEEFINKFGLKLDTTIHVNSKENNVYLEATKFNPRYIAGGCSYNTIRVMNWMFDSKQDLGSFACLGSVGEDYHGELYRELLNQEYIQPIFENIPTGETGKCAVVCYKRERTHLTDLGASTSITEEFVNKNWDEISKAKLVFTELYILSSRKPIVLKLAEMCLDKNKLFGFNFPATFFLNKFSEDILEMISYGDVIFANKEEAKFFVTEVLNQNYNDDSELAIILSMIPKKNKDKNRIFIVTCGPEPAHICVYNHKTEQIVFKGSFEPCWVEKEKVVDTNGAGDSFAGGFLAYHEKGYDYESCMFAGHWAAAKIIQTRGCDIPFYEKPNPRLNNKNKNTQSKNEIKIEKVRKFSNVEEKNDENNLNVKDN